MEPVHEHSCRCTNKIVVVGAGSATFGTNTLSALLRSKPLRGSQLALVDTDASALKVVASLADRLNKEWNAQFTIGSYLSHKDGAALQGARFVVCSVEVGPREELWESDYSIPLKYGVRQPYAENGGPAGFAHAARNIGTIMDIVRDMERICPDALFINYTNPMIRICDAVNRHSKIKCVGLCHQIYAAYGMIGVALSKELGINVPPELQGMHAAKDQHLSHKLLKEQTLSRINVRAAGLNHLTWVLSVHEQKSGKDLYPLLRERFFELDPSFEPLTREIFSLFPLLPGTGDTHLCEYLPWFRNPSAGSHESYKIRLYDWKEMAEDRQIQRKRLKAMANYETDIDELLHTDSEGAVELIESIVQAIPYYHLAANLPNVGQISNLPVGVTVETPVLVDGDGVHAVTIGDLPAPIAELCAREVRLSELCVDSVITGDKVKAMQCLMLDPFVTDISVSRKILDDYLMVYKDYLPTFQKEPTE